MTLDKQRNNNNISKKEQMRRSKKQEEIASSRKKNDDSDSDSSSFNSDDDDGEDDLDIFEYRKLLANMFPSKHMNKKVKMGEKVKKTLNKISEEDDEDSEEEKDNRESVKNKKKSKDKSSEARDLPKQNKKKDTKNTKRKESNEVMELRSRGIPKRNLKDSGSEYEPEEEEEETDEYDSDEYDTEEDDTEEDEDNAEEDEDDEEEEKDKKNQKKNNKKSEAGKYNIIFTIGGKDDAEEEEEDEDEEWQPPDSEENEFENTENEDEDVSSCSESSEEDKRYKKTKRRYVYKIKNKKTSENPEENAKKEDTKKEDMKKEDTKKEDVKIEKPALEKSKENDEEIMEQLKSIQEKNKDNTKLNDCIKIWETELNKNKKRKEKKVQKRKDKNERIFRHIIRDKNTMNDFSFFNKLEVEEQIKIIKEVREVNKITHIEKPYRIALLESKIPAEFKASAMKKINSLKYMEPGSGEFYKIKNWVDTFMRIPFGKYETLPVNISDGVEKCHEFMENAQKTLDNAVYGMNDSKMQIMQMLGQLVTNPKAIGTSIAIHGPPGTGKTSLCKEGISKILNRPFAFIALGGATDSSFLEGHSYTYEGSIWGRIVQILIDSKCMNPVIYFDELDKISDTPKGEEIAGILTHLTDTSQNSEFHDKYFSEIDFDLSKCLFIFSYNDESKVNSILKDRMYRIQTKGYNQKQKTVIGNQYLLPRIREQVKFSNDEIVIPDDVIHYIIENHCNKEDGVRNLKRCLEIVYTKLNLYRLMKPGTNLFEEDMSIKVSFPFTVTKDIIDKLIKKENTANPSLYSMYV